MEDYDYLNSFLNKIFLYREKEENKYRISHMNLYAMEHKTKAISGFAMIYWANKYNEKSRSASRDIETLFFFRMRAIDDKISGAEEPPRSQDVRDIYLILKIMDEHDIYDIKNTKMNSCVQYFPQARDFMSGREP